MIGALTLLVGGCASMSESDDTTAGDMESQQARQRYAQCVAKEAQKEAGSPAGAEDIAVAAHGRCWTSWDAYRRVTNAAFAKDARTLEERQLAHDKADAQIRQAELETRRSVIDGLVQQTLTQKP